MLDKLHFMPWYTKTSPESEMALFHCIVHNFKNIDVAIVLAVPKLRSSVPKLLRFSKKIQKIKFKHKTF